MNVVFLGGGGFSVPVMEIIQGGDHTICAVVSRPDMITGRKRKVVETPAARWARENDIPVIKRSRVSKRGFEEEFRSLGADIALIADFGEILKPFVFDWVPRGFFGIHPSLLPRWRGAAPIPWTILSGDTETGVTVFSLSSGVDTGQIALIERTTVGEKETAEELEERLARIGGRLTERVLYDVERGKLQLKKQMDEGAKVARKLCKEDGRLDWGEPSIQLERRVRAFVPWPGTWFEARGTRISVLKAENRKEEGEEAGRFLGIRRTADGEYGAAVSCGTGMLIMSRLQNPGKNPVSGRDWVNGFRIRIGDMLC